ncbi:hypothetical protein [Spirosoma validum]|uniref:SH3 domain-containing protein n=1 Tax=Spirosoma validum TaxID=2771355 RepID=A0A927GC24_9BACT|nr:hypothetical protein [Spirosoma validum]MBD2752006.1 hypothetical protein [Spirosoma validum]
MKHRLLTALLLLITATTYAQVGIGTTTPDPSAQLDVVATDKGVLVPRVTSTTAVSAPTEGLLVYQTGSPAGFYVRQAGAWVRLVTETDLPSTVLPFFSGTTITFQPALFFVGLSSNGPNSTIHPANVFYPALPRSGTLTALTVGISPSSNQTLTAPFLILAQVYRADLNSNSYSAIPGAQTTILIPPFVPTAGRVFEAKITGLFTPLAEGSHLLIGFSALSQASTPPTGYVSAALSIK